MIQRSSFGRPIRNRHLRTTIIVFVGALLLSAHAGADRLVLSPTGTTLNPDAIRTEFAISPNRTLSDMIWLEYSTPQGIELEAERLDIAGDPKKLYSANIQYPVFPAYHGIPDISMGIRDLTGTGTEHGALYLAAGRAVPLSHRQSRFLADLRLDAGLGTGRIGGPFVGAEARLRSGLSLYAEVYRHRPNFGIALPVARGLQARAYSLDGSVFYGMSYTWSR